ELPRVFRDGSVVAYPALADAGTTVDVRLFETPDAAQAAMWAGTRRLILLGAPSPVKSIAGGLSTRAKLALSHNPHGGVAAMFADCVNCAADYLMAEAGGPAWDRVGFERLSASVRSGLHEVTAEVVNQVEAALRLAHSVGARLDDNYADMLQPAVADMRAQLSGLIYPGFVAATGYRRLPHLTRYLRGIERRLDKLPENPARDAANMAIAQRAEQACQQAVADLPAARRPTSPRCAGCWRNSGSACSPRPSAPRARCRRTASSLPSAACVLSRPPRRMPCAGVSLRTMDYIRCYVARQIPQSSLTRR